MKSISYALQVQDHLLRGGPPPCTDAALRVALHDQEPNDSDEQTAHEIQGLGRAAIDRRPNSWTVDGWAFINAAPVRFPQATGAAGQRIARFWSLAESDGKIKIHGKLQKEQEVVSGLLLEFKPGTLRSEEF